MKRLTAIILAAVMMFALCACSGGNGGETAANADPLTKDDVISITLYSHASWPYNENWKIWDYIAEASGATLDITAIPESDVSTKVSLMFSSPELLTDVLCSDYAPGLTKYVSQGALIALDDMKENMPNYNSWLESLSEEEYNSNVATRKSYDGKVYMSPVIGKEKSVNVRAWLYREDIFKKNGLEAPETFDELYEVCKKLKEIYPDSYPFCVRSKLANLSVTGASWKPYWYMGAYYDYNEEKWEYGAREDIMLEILTFYNKMVTEGLMPPDFMTMNNTSWQELITTDRGFIMPEYQTRIDFFNSMAHEANPDFKLQAIVPPVANSETGAAMVNKYNIDPDGMILPNTGNEKRIANAAKFLDWFYTDEAKDLVSWGKEGETFEVKDGKKHYIGNMTEAELREKYGFGTYGTMTRIDPEIIDEFMTPEVAETCDMVLEHTMPLANPTQTICLNEEEQAIIEEYTTAVDTYANEMTAKFILGQEPLSKFDEFVKTLNEMGADKILEAYESAYSRVK